MTSLQIAKQQYLEARRANKAKENEIYRSNLAQEDEKARSNKAQEALAKRQQNFQLIGNLASSAIGATGRIGSSVVKGLMGRSSSSSSDSSSNDKPQPTQVTVTKFY